MKRRCKYGKLKRPVGSRICRRPPSKNKRARKKKRIARIRRENREYDKMDRAGKAAYLKRKLPQYVELIDANPHLYGWRR